MIENLTAKVSAAADIIATEVETAIADPSLKVTVSHYTTDRPHSTVMVHYAGKSIEARHGYLHKAATSLGLQLGAYKGKTR